jgi:hypothetical protein
MKLYMFRTVRLPVIRNLFTVHLALVHAIQVCRQLSSRTRMELQFHPGPARKLSTSLYDIYRDADKSLARPERKQATATEDFEFHISYL